MVKRAQFMASFPGFAAGLSLVFAGLPAPLFAASGATSADTAATAAVRAIEAELGAVRHSRADVRVPSGWPLPHVIPAIERFFDDPLALFPDAARWGDRVEFATGLADLAAVATAVFEVPRRTPNAFAPVEMPALPADVSGGDAAILTRAYEAFARASPLAARAADSITPSARARLLALHGLSLDGDAAPPILTPTETKAVFDGMHAFDQAAMLEAGAIVLAAVDDILALPQTSAASRSSLVWPTPLGRFVIAGREDHTWTNADLRDVIFLLDRGGSNVYTGAVGAARPGEIRVVIDLGDRVSISGDDRPSAGAGIFGVGVFAAPAPGAKSFDNGACSQGCGIGGVGALLANGAVHAAATRYGQGAGVFGVGIFSIAASSGSSYELERNGQGLGMTRGLGIFRHRGDEARIRGGLVQPDPREPLGTVSLCQGVGFGRRAYGGGGLGVAVVSGDDNLVEGSYFTQGCGYWYALGLFRMRGNGSRTQARRYDLGSGVHSAFGHFQLFGDGNRILNWGVGPAFAWDSSVASALIVGNDNEIQADWGTGTAEIGGWSFTYMKGDRNRWKLPSFARGRSYRRRLGYSVHAIDGKDNRLQTSNRNARLRVPAGIMPNLWGAARFPALDVVSDLGLEPPVWSAPEQEAPIRRKEADLGAAIREAERSNARDAVLRLVDVASAFSLDKTSPKEAFRRLLTVRPADVRHLVHAVQPWALDQRIYLWPLLAAHGVDAARAIENQLPTVEPQKAALLMLQLAHHRAEQAGPLLIDGLDSDDRRLRDAALASLGLLLNRDAGAEPGHVSRIAALEALFDDSEDPRARTRLTDLLSRSRPDEAFGLLAVAGLSRPQTRLLLYEALPDDITEKIGDAGAARFISIVVENREAGGRRIAAERQDLDRLAKEVHRRLRAALRKASGNERPSLIRALGRLGHADDASLIGVYLSDDAAAVRETAAMALGALGDHAIPVLLKAMDRSDERIRRTALAAVPHSTTAAIFDVLWRGVNDPNAGVRRTAVAALQSRSPVLDENATEWKRRVREELADDPDPGVRLALEMYE